MNQVDKIIQEVSDWAKSKESHHTFVMLINEDGLWGYAGVSVGALSSALASYMDSEPMVAASVYRAMSIHLKCKEQEAATQREKGGDRKDEALN